MNIFKLFFQIMALVSFSFLGYLNASEKPLSDKSVFANGYPEPAPAITQNYPLTQLNNVVSRMTGTSPNATAEFAIEPNTLVTDLTLDFSINYSPALLSELSHIKLYLNDYLMATLDLPEQTDKNLLNKSKSWKIPLQAQVLKDYNQIRFELIGYYTQACQDDFNKNIWAELSQNAKLTLYQQQLSIDSELALLPAPFFYPSLNKMLDLTLVFGQQPSLTKLESGAIISSWFGIQADWRKSNFSTLINQLPTEHAIVIASNNSRPDFLKHYPLVDQPTVEIISNPEHRYQKLLLILGKDDEQVKQAAIGLAHASQIMSGRTVTLTQPPKIEKRQAYDAPRWLSSKDKIKFSDLIDYPDQLQAKGMGSAASSLNLRFAPDLFIWREQGVELDLLYRYTPSKSITDTRLNVLINGQFMQGYLLEEHRHDNLILNNLTIPFNTQASGEDSQTLEIPSFKLSANNTLTFDFSFAIAKTGNCTAAPKDSNYGRIDENSSISLAGYHHYIQMPNLAVFAQSGFPFTKYADLQQTLVLLGEQSSTEQYNLLFNMMAHMSASTGYPATYVTLAHNLDAVEPKNYDLFLIGQPDQFINKQNTLDVLVSNYQTILNKTLYPGQNGQQVQIQLESEGNLASIISFRSPFDNERTVVALYANNRQNYQMLSRTFQQNESLNKIKGSASLITPYGISTLETDKTYYVGELPIHQLIWFHLSDYPLVLGLLSVLVLLVLSVVIWRLLKVLTAKRLAEGDHE
ncbi:cellulose biosynthesis cyclic di-GMP-binding regulatory protein BcsB [Catenovulum sp. 2E275]|uniref:cellulose biosynthesis cyclic di-GMP-binding regulatory protein BcsB n=1 Tax=Catenovulum sp. 2E275 TaxID=2980497 RepID=UPI0021D1BABC|nr:cellulose biosynthesis cyclic di-GMP-binding regulatory protein BcsB [Catenovulum sp. 2E275]MCU4677044.1 cellulose biosynthesis cyclic di-GMP-binding regulatory protein BcsB [Catenovulum sp. 2E275]